jgi:hypothetical protein
MQSVTRADLINPDNELSEVLNILKTIGQLAVA